MTRRLLLAAGLSAAVAAAPLAAVEFVAMGDSITAGSTVGASCEECPFIFDCIPGCDATLGARDQCGHVRRLRNWIDGWKGAGDHVRNKGIGGETTMAGVTRLPGELDALCGTPGACNAVLLMHGTNDMFGSVSPETARDNLALMIGQARARKIDTLLMTIIRRGSDLEDPKWQSYHDLTAALAGSEGLQLVDAFASLCPPGGSCLSDNYWLPSQPPCNDPDALADPGHLDPDGYEVLTGLIQAAFPAAPPAAPSPTAPAGDITGGQPDFVWAEVAGTRWYELEVDGASSWWEAAAQCEVGTCTVYPGVPLAKGGHSWRVRGRNLRGLGGWSADTAFTVWEVPGTPAPSAPKGLFVDGTPMSAPFAWEPYVWTADPEATDYDLVVSDAGGPVVSQSFDDSICGGSTCSGSPAAGLAAGDYSWTVTARNPGASGPASAALAFQVWDDVPAEPTPIRPTGEYFAPHAPLYAWLPADGATEYDLEVRDSGGNLDDSAAGLASAMVCGFGLCLHQGGSLIEPDGYTLRALGRNELGDGMLSSTGADFTILSCDDETQMDLSDFVASGAVGTDVVQHCGPLTGAASGSFLIEAGADLTIHTRDGFTGHDGLTVEGQLTVQTP